MDLTICDRPGLSVLAGDQGGASENRLLLNEGYPFVSSVVAAFLVRVKFIVCKQIYRPERPVMIDWNPQHCAMFSSWWMDISAL
jgi:hypothetical protein